MDGARKIATVLLTHEELFVILAALEAWESSDEFPGEHRPLTNAIRGQIHQARQRTGNPRPDDR
jgi:hypothetical protein